MWGCLPPSPLPPPHFLPLLLLCCLRRILQSWIVGPIIESAGKAAVTPYPSPQPPSSSSPGSLPSPPPPSLTPPPITPPSISPSTPSLPPLPLPSLLPPSSPPPSPRPESHPSPSPLPPSSPLRPRSLLPKSYVFMGCYKDTPIRALPTQLDNNGGLTAEVSVSCSYECGPLAHGT